MQGENLSVSFSVMDLGKINAEKLDITPQVFRTLFLFIRFFL